MTIQTTTPMTVNPIAPPKSLFTPADNAGASFPVATYEVAARTVKKFIRSPQLIIAGTAQGALFLLIFRYVFGGAIAHTGSLSYVDFVIPGFVVTSVPVHPLADEEGAAPARPVSTKVARPH